MDVLAEILNVTQMGNALIGQAELIAPWGLEVDANVQAAVHVVQTGSCWMRIGKGTPIHLNAGDLVLLTGGVRHVLADSATRRAYPYKEALADASRRYKANRKTRFDATTLLCAEYAFDQAGAHPLLAVLPKLIHIPAAAGGADDALQALVNVLLGEARKRSSGADLVIPRLIDCLLVFVVRRWLDAQPEGSAGWFGALRDPQIGRALSLIHEQPARRWTVDQLAKKVFQSRATFARRFVALVGEPPLTYSNRWRMIVATRLLRTTNTSVEAISEQVGFESAAAFSKTFRRLVRSSPGQFRTRYTVDRLT